MGTVTTTIIRELPGLHTIDLRVAPGTSTQAAIAKALDMDLPDKPGKIGSKSGSDINVFCLAPDWWLIVGLPEAEKKLAPLKNDHHFSIVDVSGQRTTIELEGPQVRDVLLSGGDPLVLAPKILEEILSRLRAIPHIEIVRLGTRVPVFMPMRVTQELCDMLAKYHPLWINIHVNHSSEISLE